MPFLYGCENGDASNCPCKRDEICLSDGHYADKKQEACKFVGFGVQKYYPELMDELKRTLEAMEIDYYKPAVKCVRNRILSGKLK